MGDLLYLQHAAKSHPEFGVKIWQKSPKSMAFLYFNIKTFLFGGFLFFQKGYKNMNYTELNHFQFRYHKYNFNVKDEVYIIKNRFFFTFRLLLL